MADSWNSFFAKVKPSLNRTVEELAEILLAEWREFIWTEFYSVPENTYKRSYETIKSLSFLNVNKTSNGLEITIGYDASKIHTFQNGDWLAHEKPDEMGSLVEYGSIYGHAPDGIRAVEDMQKRINSPWFKNKFKQLMKQKGYDILIK